LKQIEYSPATGGADGNFTPTQFSLDLQVGQTGTISVSIF